MVAQRKNPAAATAGFLIMSTIVISIINYHETRQFKMLLIKS